MGNTMSEQKKYDYVRFAVADMHGRSRGRIVTGRHAAQYLKSGVNLFGGYLNTSIDDVNLPLLQYDLELDATPLAVALPSEDTLHEVPWSGGDKFKVGEIICESYWLKDKSRQKACPRYVARCQLEKLREYGFNLLSGFEVEFILENPKGVPSSESDLSYMSHRLHAKYDEFLFELEHQMYQAGVDIENIHSEDDIDMFETITKASIGIKSPDAAFVLKNGILEFAEKRGYSINFDSNYVSLHFNHSLLSAVEETNAFINKSSPDDLSDLAKHWIAGVLKHAKALTALYCPTVECFERLHKTDSPGPIFWGFSEETAIIRAKLYTSDKGPYLENRVPCGMSNPYLIMAATVAAGIDGLVNKLECPPPGHLEEEDNLPRTLSGAIEELKTDQVLADSLGHEFVEWFVTVMEYDVKTYDAKKKM